MIKQVNEGDILQAAGLFFRVNVITQDAIITQRCAQPDEKPDVLLKPEKAAKKKKR